MELISTLAGVVVGFALAAIWEYWKDARKTKKEGQSVRAMLSQEIMYNVKFLTGVRDSVMAEQAKYEATFKRNSSGGWTSEGNPTQVLVAYHFSSLSRQVWETYMQLLPSALSAREIESAFSFYSNLNSVIEAHDNFDQFLHSGHNSPSVLIITKELLDKVIKQIEETLKNYPKL